jgi:hypothetical protein
MGLEADWLQMGSTTVRLESATGFDGYGQPTYGPVQVLPAVVQADRRNIHMGDGRTEQAVAMVFVLSTAAHVGMQDRLVIADSTAPVRLLAVDSVDDETGRHHTEVTLG